MKWRYRKACSWFAVPDLETVYQVKISHDSTDWNYEIFENQRSLGYSNSLYDAKKTAERNYKHPTK